MTSTKVVVSVCIQLGRVSLSPPRHMLKGGGYQLYRQALEISISHSASMKN